MKSRSFPIVSGLIILFTLSCPEIKAQENQIIPLNQNVYHYIKNFQNRGMMHELNPTAMPYTKAAVQEALRAIDRSGLNETELSWYRHIEKVIGFGKQEDQNKRELYTHGMLGGGFDLNNTLREDGIRASDDKPYFLPNGELQLYGEGGNFGGQLGLRHDLFYYYDPDGILPYGRLYVRSEDFYFGYNSNYLQLYAGRFNSHWAPFREASTILSDNPNSYDNISFTFGNHKISVQGIFGQLGNLGTDNEFGLSSRVNGQRRFLAVHRINWRPVLNIQLSLIKADVYASNNSSISLKYFNPFNDLFFDRTGAPVNDHSNSFVGGFLWFNKNNFTLNGQVMLDDIHVTDNNERMTLSVTGSIHVSKILEGVDAGLESELISYQSYNTSTQKSTRYVFLKKGLATPFNDYILNSVYSNIYANNLLSGLTVTPRITALFQGEQTINQPFYQLTPDGDLPNIVLTGTVERTLRGAVEFLYNPTPEFWIDGEIGVNSIENKHNMAGNSDTQLTGRIEAGFRLSLDGIVGNK